MNGNGNGINATAVGEVLKMVTTNDDVYHVIIWL